MKKVGALLLFLYSLTVFSQEKKNYYFDNYTINNCKLYQRGFNGKNIHIVNSNNSDYFLMILISEKLKEASLYDYKNNIMIKFDLDVEFEFKTISDLNKLKSAQVVKRISRIAHEKKYPNIIYDIEHERDSVSGKTIVHVTGYKNNKRKKIISEVYYFVGPNGKLDQYNLDDFKKFFVKNYNLEFSLGDSLEKILCLTDGKINSEYEMIESKKVDFNFEFIIDEKQLLIQTY